MRPPQPDNINDDDNEDEDEDEEIRTRLRHRRLELDHEIEVFKTRKDAEYRRFEESLWAEVRAKANSNNDQSTIGKGITSHQVTINLAGSLLEEKLQDTFREATLSTPTPLKSPPFEKELQVAGLFAPCYLPLLEDRPRDPPPLLSPITTAELAMDAGENENSSSPPKSAGSSPELPAVPLASSLKSSSESYFDTPGRGRSGRKPKSPKKVTFQFDDENSVPSRSSPPPTKVVWSFGGTEDEDDCEDDVSRELHTADGREESGRGYDDYSPEDRIVAKQMEDVAMPTAVSFPITRSQENPCHFPRSHGDQLVTPLAFGTFDADNGSGAATVSPNSSLSPKTENWTSQLNSSPTNGNMGMTGDDDDDALFDLDETVPDQPQQTPPHRDLSPLIEAAMAAQQLPSSTNMLNLPSPLRASYGAAIPLPGSVDLISFGKSPLASSAFQPKYTSAFSTSFTLAPKQPESQPSALKPAPVASSLPATSMWGSFTSPRLENGRFRRRSINKYVPSPPPEEETLAIQSPETIPEDAPISPFGTSMPVTITPRLSSLRSPPASTSPLNHSPAPPTTTLSFDTAEAPTTVEASPPHSSEVDSYLRTARFPSANGGMMSPYRTKFAQELAQQALLDGDDVGESIVGGVDGCTGLDPESFSVRAHHGRNSSFASPAGAGSKRWSLSARMAEENEMEARARGGL